MQIPSFKPNLGIHLSLYIVLFPVLTRKYKLGQEKFNSAQIVAQATFKAYLPHKSSLKCRIND